MAVALLARRREVSAGLLVGIALAKPTMAVPFLGFLAVRRHWKALAAALAFQVLALLAMLAQLGRSPVLLLHEWLGRAREQASAGLIDVPSVLERIWPGCPVPTGLVSGLVLGLGLVALIAWRRRSDLELVSLCTFTAALFAYHRPYDLVLLIPPFALVLEDARRTRSRFVAGLLILIAVVMMAPTQPAVISEGAYNAVFIPLCYVLLALMILSLTRRRPTEESVPKAPASASLGKP